LHSHIVEPKPTSATPGLLATICPRLRQWGNPELRGPLKRLKHFSRLRDIGGKHRVRISSHVPPSGGAQMQPAPRGD
jgi:hypothetical protein